MTDTGAPKAKGAEPIDGFPPTFTEKPKIVPNESGTLVTMRFRVRSKPKAEMQWYKGNQKIQEGQKFKTKYVDLGKDEYEVVLEISVSFRKFYSGQSGSRTNGHLLIYSSTWLIPLPYMNFLK